MALFYSISVTCSIIFLKFICVPPQVTFPKVKAKLKLDNVQKNKPELSQACFSH